MAVNYRVEVSGLRQVIDALEEVDKSAKRRIERAIRKGGNQVVAAAKRRVPANPLSGWGPWTESTRGRDLGYEASAVISGIRLQKSNFKRRGVSAGFGFDVYNKNPAGAIFEVIGGKTKVGLTDYNWQGPGFVDRIKDRFPGKNPRILLPAYYEGLPDGFKEQIRDQIIDEARKAGLR